MIKFYSDKGIDTMLKKNNVGWIFLLCSLSTRLLIAGSLYCDSPIKDFGEINEGDKVSHVFTVRNVTQKSITVSRVMASCGCITSLNKQFELKAGEQVKVPIEFNSMGYSGKTIQKQIVLLVGDEQKKPVLTLTIKGNIKGIPPQERINVIPSEKYIFNDVGKVNHITIRGPANKNIEISVKGPEWLDVKMSKPQEHQTLPINQWNLEFSLNRKFIKRVKEVLVITTNLPLFEKVAVPIYVEPKPTINVSPPVLFINNKGPGKTYTKELNITLLGNLLKKDIKQEKPNDLKFKAVSKTQPVNSELTSTKVRELPIHIQPSNNCITVQPVTTSPDKIKYTISIHDCDSTVLNLQIMIKDVCIRKVPVIISGLSTDKRNSEK